MILNAYTLHDTKAAAFSPPFFASAHGHAVRMVMDLAADLSTTVGRHPKDFALYCVGRFDDQSGEMLPATREHVSDVISLTPTAFQGNGLFEDAPRSEK